MSQKTMNLIGHWQNIVLFDIIEDQNNALFFEAKKNLKPDQRIIKQFDCPLCVSSCPNMETWIQFIIQIKYTFGLKFSLPKVYYLE